MAAQREPRAGELTGVMKEGHTWEPGVRLSSRKGRSVTVGEVVGSGEGLKWGVGCRAWARAVTKEKTLAAPPV